MPQAVQDRQEVIVNLVYSQRLHGPRVDWRQDFEPIKVEPFSACVMRAKYALYERMRPAKDRTIYCIVVEDNVSAFIYCVPMSGFRIVKKEEVQADAKKD